MDVHVGALDVLSMARSGQHVLHTLIFVKDYNYLHALLNAGADFYVEVSAQLLESCEAVVGDVGLGEVGDDVFDCGIVFLFGLLRFFMLFRHVGERAGRDDGGRWLRTSRCANIYANETDW